MLIQIKAIRKKETPATWRRAMIPAGITFAQLAYVLEVMLEFPVTDQYEFEFYHEKERFREWAEGNEPNDYYYSYFYAPDMFIDDILEETEWFTFRIRTGQGDKLPEYRIEIEKLLKSAFLNNPDREILFPCIVVDNTHEGDSWSDSTQINQYMEEHFYTRTGFAEYLTFNEIVAETEKHPGIICCGKPESKPDRARPSADQVLQYIGDMLKGKTFAF